MGGINAGRWFLGGIVAGVVIAVVDVVLNGMIFGQRWVEAMTAMNLPALGGSSAIFFIIMDLIIGLIAVWIYVGIRPRYGPSATTAVYAGLATWALAVLAPSAFYLVAGLFPADLVWSGLIVSLISYVVGTVAGAYLYQEG